MTFQMQVHTKTRHFGDPKKMDTIFIYFILLFSISEIIFLMLCYNQGNEGGFF